MQIVDDIYLVGSEQFGVSHLLDCNCYLIDHGEGLALVDTGLGMGVASILENIRGHGLDPDRLTHVLLTHTHLGHWGGAAEIRELTAAEVWGPDEGRRFMEAPDTDPVTHQNLRFGRWPKDLNPRACPPDHTFGDATEIALGSGVLRTIRVQGHTKDSTCFLWESRAGRTLVTGDVVFYGGAIGMINAEGSSLAEYRRDISKLAELGVDILLPGHGVFVLRNGQKHIERAIRKLSDFVLPESFFEPNEFVWQQDYSESLED